MLLRSITVGRGLCFIVAQPDWYASLPADPRATSGSHIFPSVIAPGRSLRHGATGFRTPMTDFTECSTGVRSTVHIGNSLEPKISSSCNSKQARFTENACKYCTVCSRYKLTLVRDLADARESFTIKGERRSPSSSVEISCVISSAVS